MLHLMNKYYFDEKIKSDTQITDMFNASELDELFSYTQYTHYADDIYARVYGPS